MRCSCVRMLQLHQAITFNIRDLAFAIGVWCVSNPFPTSQAESYFLFLQATSPTARSASVSTLEYIISLLLSSSFFFSTHNHLSTTNKSQSLYSYSSKLQYTSLLLSSSSCFYYTATFNPRAKQASSTGLDLPHYLSHRLALRSSHIDHHAKSLKRRSFGQRFGPLMRFMRSGVIPQSRNHHQDEPFHFNQSTAQLLRDR